MIFRFDGFLLDSAAFELRRDGQAIPVEPQTLTLIAYLVENRDRLITRDELFETLWKGRPVTDWAISAAIKSARAALGQGRGSDGPIRTVHGRGYRFVGAVDAGPSADTGTELPRLIVLPFDMLSPGSEGDYRADGFTEDLISELSHHPGLAVLSRNASFRLRGQRPEASELRQRFQATHAVEGSMRLESGQLRVNAQLRDLAADRQVWIDRFDGDGESVFAMQDAILGKLVDALKIDLMPKTRGLVPDPKAYDLCLRGRQAYFRYGPQNIKQALAFFAEAAEVDPNYAEAIAYQSYCKTTLYVFAHPGADNDLSPAERLARKAVSLDPGSAVAHARLGWVLGFLGRSEETIDVFQKACRLAERNAEVFHTFGETLNRLGQPVRALEFLERAMRMEQFAPPSWDFARGHSHVLLRNYDDALRHIQPVLEQLPGFVPGLVQLTRLYCETDRPDLAAETARKLAKAAPHYRIWNAERMFPYPDEVEKDRLVSALEKAGVPL